MSANLELFERSHYRFNLLTREWVLVSPKRINRPWLGRVEKKPVTESVPYDPECSMCPSNMRLEGVRNPMYTGPFVFDNAFPSLSPDISPASVNQEDLLKARSGRGICRMICFSPIHDITMAEMTTDNIRQVVNEWVREFRELGSQEFIHYVQIFENKGRLMGAGYPHPHGQIWASEILPDELAKEQTALGDYMSSKASCLLCDYLGLELVARERLVCENDHFVALVPFWAFWPFETILLSKRHVACLLDLEDTEKAGLADILKRLLVRYDNLFGVSFPYAFGFHQRPTDCKPDGNTRTGRPAYPEWHLHAHVYPPLLRSATIRKYVAGYELLATLVRDVTPEWSAEQLRGLSETHYRELGNAQ